MLSCWWSSGRGCWRWMSFRVLPRGCFLTWFVLLKFENPLISYHSAVFLRLYVFLILQLKMSLTWADRLLRSFSSSSPYDKRVKTQLVADVPGMPRHISYGTSRWLSWKTATDMRSEVKEISEKTSGLSLHSLKRGNLPVLPCKTRVFWLSGSRWSVWCPMTTMWSTKLVRWKPGWVRWMQPPQKGSRKSAGDFFVEFPLIWVSRVYWHIRIQPRRLWFYNHHWLYHPTKIKASSDISWSHKFRYGCSYLRSP